MQEGRVSGGRRAGRGLRASFVREVGLGLVVAGVVVLLFVAYDLLGTNFAEQSSQARLAKQFSAALAHAAAPARSAAPAPARAGTATKAASTSASRRASATRAQHTDEHASPRASTKPSGVLASTANELRRAGMSSSALKAALGLPIPGGAIGHIVVPAIGVNRYVVQGVDEQDLQMGPGHYPGTPLPGQVGNVGIAGHRTTFGAPFFRLNELRKGDLIYLTDLSGITWVYSVQRSWVVYPNDVAVLGPTRGAELTLTTCNPRFWATTRLVVRAGLVGRLAPGAKLVVATGSLPASLSALERATARTGRQMAAGGAGNAHKGATPRLLPAKPMPAGPLTGPSPTPGASGPTSSSPALSPGATAGQHAGGVGTSSLGAAGLGSPGASASTWAAAVGWGALAVALWVLTRLFAARKRRFAKFGLIVAGSLACLVPLWFAFGAVVGLLPANF